MSSQTAPRTPASANHFRHVAYRWNDADAPDDPLERLVYRSNLLGSDQRITNTGGGNTSSKLIERDPLTGEAVEVLWVKGSGGDLRTATRANFASLHLERLRALQGLYTTLADTGLKTPAEDAMVGYYPHCTFNLNPRASSIDTPLHAFLPAKHVDHMHPNAVIAIAASKRAAELTREVFGDDIGYIEWMRPGFELGLAMQRMVEANPRLRGILMGGHGIINWAEDDHECYDLTLSLIERAAHFIDTHDKGSDTFGGERYQSPDSEARRDILCELLPWLRGCISAKRRFIATVQHDEAMLRFVNSNDAARLAALGTSCPDHFLRTKIRPLYVEWDPQSRDLDALRSGLQQGLEEYRSDYAAYYERCRRDDSPAMRDPNPTVILIPGLGMIAWGKDKSESRVTAEFYNCAVEVMRGAEAIDTYTALPPQEAFDIEYWSLEEAKLQRMPRELSFARRIVVIIGAGNGIGRASALRFAREGAHVVCADLDLHAAQSTAGAIEALRGPGIGVAGTDISACGSAIALQVDVTHRKSIRELFKDATLAYGGIDDVIMTAGLFLTAEPGHDFDEHMWQKTFDVNVKGAWLVAEEAKRLWQLQGLDGSLVLTTSVNAVVSKRGSLAYDTSKAAANHLVRELAVELSPSVRVNAVAPATVIAGSTMFPRERVIASLRKYGIDFDESATTESLRDQLAAFYATRTLTKALVTAEDQAEAIYFLCSAAAAKTTGQIIAVDGGLHEAFLR